MLRHMVFVTVSYKVLHTLLMLRSGQAGHKGRAGQLPPRYKAEQKFEFSMMSF